MGIEEIPAFNKTEGVPLLVLSNDGIVDQTKNSMGVLVYFTVMAKIPIAVNSRILGCMKILYDEGERLGIKGSFIGVIRDSDKNGKECCNVIGLGYIAEEVAFTGISNEECAELFLPVQITI